MMQEPFGRDWPVSNLFGLKMPRGLLGRVRSHPHMRGLWAKGSDIRGTEPPWVAPNRSAPLLVMEAVHR